MSQTTTTVQAEESDPQNTLIIELSTGGPVVIEMKPDIAPKHVERIKTLANQGFYNGVVFHRVIEGFMAQTGDPTGTGMGGSDLPDLEAEFNSTHHGRGSVSMARTNDPDTANSQFFVCFKDCGFLDNQYTVWGQVTAGMEFVDKLAVGEPPADPDKIVSMKLAASAEGEATTAAEAPATPAETVTDTAEMATDKVMDKAQDAVESIADAVDEATGDAMNKTIEPAAAEGH